MFFVISQCLLFVHVRWKWEKWFIFYTAFMQMLSIGPKLTVRHIGRQMKPEDAAKMISLMLLMFWVLLHLKSADLCVYYVLFNIQKGQCMHVNLICIFEKSNFLWVKRSVYCLCHSSQCVTVLNNKTCVAREMPACEFYVQLLNVSQTLLLTF